MSRNSVSTRPWRVGQGATLRAGLVGIAIAAGGCSADISRFDSPFFGMNDSSTATGSIGNGASAGPGNLSEQTPSYTGGGYGTSSRPGEIRSAALPDPAPAPYRPEPTYQPAAGAAPAPRALAPASRPVAAPAARPEPAAATTAAGETVEVQQGDTLFGIARRHNVRVEDVKRLNNLSSTMIRPGQRLVMPAGAGRAATVAAAARRVAAPNPVAAEPAAPVAEAPVGNADGTYTLKPGDSLYTIARANKLSMADLQRINNIADPRKVRVGTVLKLREDGARPAVAAQRAPSVAVTPAASEPTPALSPIATTTRPTIINGGAPTAGTQVAAVDQRATLSDASPAPAGSAGTEVASAATSTAQMPPMSFRWPAKGRVLSNFGPRPDGTHNDGVDIAVPLGAEVVAAESGVVAYAGNELKGFGNLVLIRHEGGWVTAYAHNEELLVKRGDKVRRGQGVAKAGKSGSVDQPMVHFEIRQGSKPIDPIPYLEK
ncbi:MAG: peptidoglycan DD-metalloendopeptidase family protein [Hyphomicrobiaceae bacterium]